MRVMIAISHSFCSNFIKGQAAFLKSKGHEVIIVSAPGPEVREVALSEGARLIELPIEREISLLGDIKAVWKIRRVIQNVKPDIINSGNPKTGFLFSLQKLLFIKPPIIFTLRGLRSDTLTGFKRKIVILTERISCTLPNLVIVISPSLKEHAIHRNILPKNKGRVILEGSSNGINLERFTPDKIKLEDIENMRHSWGCDKDTVVLGFVGRLTKDKGVRELYRAFLSLKEKHNNIKLVLTGPLEEDDVIENDILIEMKAHSDIFLLGSQKDIPLIIKSYDVLVLYSYREGFGNVALEGSAMEIPIVVSDIPGARDTVIQNQTGLLVKTKDVNALAASLEVLILNPHKRKKMGLEGRKRVLRSFDSKKIWQGQLDIYEEFTK